MTYQSQPKLTRQDFYNRLEVLSMLGISATTLVRWIDNGTLPPPIELPGAKMILFNRKDIDQWLGDRATRAAAREGVAG